MPQFRQFSRISYLENLPVVDPNRRHGSYSQWADNAVKASVRIYSGAVSKRYRAIAILAHTRGVLGHGCRRTAQNREALENGGDPNTATNHIEFVDTVVFTDVTPNGYPILVRCTNCQWSQDRWKRVCGAVPVESQTNMHLSLASIIPVSSFDSKVESVPAHTIVVSNTIPGRTITRLRAIVHDRS
jgi:hypothetical protein